MKILKSIGNYNIKILLCIIIFTQILYSTINFSLYKTGFHSDELWSYGFACSSDTVDIYMPKGREGLKNFDEWTDSSVLYDYITVDKTEFFDYKSVYINSADDYQPPLYFWLLHFICSLFPGVFSKYFGFAVTLLSFIIQQFFLFKLLKSMTHNDLVGLIGVFFYGFTTAAEDVLFYLRMYSPAACLAVVLLYYMTEFYNHRDDKVIPKSLIIKLFITTFLGCFTVHLFLIMAFAVTVIYCLYYIFTKRIKNGAIFGFTMLISALLSIALFPSTIEHLFGSGGSYGDHIAKYPPDFQFRYYFYYLTNDLFGIGKSPYKTMTLEYILYGIGIFFFFFIPFCFIFRNENWLKRFLSKIKETIKAFVKRRRMFSFCFIPVLVAVLFILILNAYMTSIYAMGRVACRYIFIIYPLMAAFSVAFVAYLLDWIFTKKRVKTIVSVALATIFAVLSILMAPHSFRFNYSHTGIALDELESDSNCIIVLSAPFLLTCTTNNVGKTDNFIATTYESYETANYNTDIDLDSAPLYLLLDVSTIETGNFSAGGIGGANINFEVENNPYDREMFLSFYEGLDFVSKCELVGIDYNLFGRKVEIYRLN